MAAKTIVCPECGSSAAPGRYACPECGALLASVALTPRSQSAGSNDDGMQDVEVGTDIEPSVAVANPPDPDQARQADEADGALMAEVALEPDEADKVGPALVTTPAYLKVGRSRSKARPSDRLSHADASVPFDEDAPLSSGAKTHAALEPDILHDLPDAPAADSDRVEALGDSAPSDEAGQPAATADSGVGPGWPPPGDHGVVTRPEPRTPAGSYLPPSAILPPLDVASGVVGGAAASSLDAGSIASPPDRGPAAWADRGSAALAGAFDTISVTGDAARRTIAVGSGLAAIGLLLPWVNGLPNANPFAGYLDRWGLAGPGMWLVLFGLVALAILAGSSGRVASWPIGLPSVATAAFVGGLLWPYLVGGFGRSIGIWVVLAGTIVLAVGGVFDRRARHAGSDPAVPNPDAGGR